jgi:hypothetical protein
MSRSAPALAWPGGRPEENKYVGVDGSDKPIAGLPQSAHHPRKKGNEGDGHSVVQAESVSAHAVARSVMTMSGGDRNRSGLPYSSNAGYLKGLWPACMRRRGACGYRSYVDLTDVG